MKKEKVQLPVAITIIGGGAAGMIAALCAARKIGGTHVRLIEKNEKLGRKLLATGNGRCNLSNRFCASWFVERVPQIYELFDVQETLDFFSQIGLHVREEGEGRLYPYSEQSTSVVDVLTAALKELNVEILLNCQVKDVQQDDKMFSVLAEMPQAKKQLTFMTKTVIIATGGKAGPQFGSCGDGFSMAKKFGHTVLTPFPSLTQILSVNECFQTLKGVRAKGKVSLFCCEKFLVQEEGEIQFTAEGLSGICIFNLSRYIRLKEHCYEDYRVCIDLLPEFEELELEEFLLQRKKHLSERHLEQFFAGLLAPKLAKALLDEVLKNDCKMREPIKKMSLQMVKKLANILKNWQIIVSGTKGWKEAQVTCGGVDLTQLHKETLESFFIKGLFFAGEVSDFDGPCGGYNLQWAWSSGQAAGLGAVKRLQKMEHMDEKEERNAKNS